MLSLRAYFIQNLCRVLQVQVIASEPVVAILFLET